MDIDLKSLFKDYNILLNDEQVAQFNKYYDLLIEWNEKMNLTAITERKDVYIKHFLDSCLCYELVKDKKSIVDVGTGAGFPSIPLKILLPDTKFTLVDSLNKRLIFLDCVIKELNLKDVNCVHSRAEDFAVKNRENFDCCVARAVARLDTLSELCLPLVKVGGCFVALKSQDLEEELKLANIAIKTCGGEVKLIKDFVLPDNIGVRKILLINKVKNTPNKYPRGQNKPKLSPIK
jgi:16S rRNA (guanine527-N7)-methyltransferase